ncbi:MAG: O-methyltransferase [Thermoleophilaceae bacterium]|jgi:O-methyltransferase|nr:O-methyltransferase [Thermoleophilaceae bacterium]
MLLLRAEGTYLRSDSAASFLVVPAEQSQFELSPVAAHIVDAVGSPSTSAEVCARLTAHFDVSLEECSEAVETFVRELVQMGVVEEIDERASGEGGLRRPYLDLLKRALVNLIYPEDAMRIEAARAGELEGDRHGDMRRLRDIRYRNPEAYRTLVDAKHHGDMADRMPAARLTHTMIGLGGLDNLERCAARVFADGVEGDFLEAGVCHGGASIFLRALQVAHGEHGRRTWVADTFAGVPAPTDPVDEGLDLTEDAVPWMAATLEAVQDNFRIYRLLSDNVVFLRGLFQDTLPDAPVERLAILRIDADLYSSTRDVLTVLYDRVSPGGFVIVDDYGALPQCRQAVDEFVQERALDIDLRWVDWTRVCWRKTE